MHDHSIQHTHDVVSQPSDATTRPLGVDQLVSGPAHTHRVRSDSISTSLSGDADLMPLSHVFYASVTRCGLFRVPKGTFVLYAGKGLPKHSWACCDGSKGTPDLRGLFLVVDNTLNHLATIGALSHAHDISHSHGWYATPATAAGGMGAFAGDQKTQGTVPQDTSLAPIGHIHVATGTIFYGLSGPALNEPPFVGLSVLMATEDSGMPTGAILAIAGAGTDVPWGWTAISDLSGKPLVGRFVRVTDGISGPPSFGGSAIHDHSMNHEHIVTLSAPGATTMPVVVSHDSGPPASNSDHAHTVDASFEGRTGSSDALPPFVQLRFIMKR